MNELLHHTSFMPHGMCYLWQPDILMLHVVSDSFIALAYFTIPVAVSVREPAAVDTRRLQIVRTVKPDVR